MHLSFLSVLSGSCFTDWMSYDAKTTKNLYVMSHYVIFVSMTRLIVLIIQTNCTTPRSCLIVSNTWEMVERRRLTVVALKASFQQ